MLEKAPYKKDSHVKPFYTPENYFFFLEIFRNYFKISKIPGVSITYKLSLQNRVQKLLQETKMCLHFKLHWLFSYLDAGLSLL